MSTELGQIVEALNELNIDALLVTDFRGRDPYALRILGLKEEQIFSRRWFVVIHKSGSIVRIAHKIEPGAVAEVLNAGYQGANFLYASRDELHTALGSALHNTSTVALCYSSKAEIPIISTLDAGTFELITSIGVKTVSAAEVLQRSFCKLDRHAYLLHLEAGKKVDQIKDEAFEFISKNAGSVTESDTVEFIINRFKKESLVTDHNPSVAVNSHSGLPHYGPSSTKPTIIKPGDFILIDLWAKLNHPSAIFYDITWVGVLREKLTSEEQKIFELVKSARDGVVDFICDRIAKSEPVFGFEADQVSRKIITKGGFGDYFSHRTGHSIGTSVHGEGANLDDFETHDTRRLIPWSCFSVEPGIYLPNFGIRSELNMFITDNEAVVTGEVQRNILTF